MTKKIDAIDYQKPELVRIDDPAFDEMGQGDSYCCVGNPPAGAEGNPNYPPPGLEDNPNYPPSGLNKQ